MTMTDATPYADAARLYQQLGWSPLPIPSKRKSPPPKGWTGYDAPHASGADVQAWLDEEPASNIGLRTPQTVLGIDVDAYDNKPGFGTLRAAMDRLGPLPPAPRSTSRGADPISGIRFYRVPAGRRWADKWPGVEFIHYGHRYAVAWPSLHPEGRTYAWYSAEGKPLAEPPSVDDLPELPAPWVAELDLTNKNLERDEAAPYDGPGFLSLPDLERDAVTRWTAAAVEGIKDTLRASASWPEGYAETYADGRARGWERLQADEAWRLARLARAGWCPLTMPEARAAFLSSAPTSATWTRTDVEAKWDAQKDRGEPAPFPEKIQAEADYLAALPGLSLATGELAPDPLNEEAEAAVMEQAAAFARDVELEARRISVREAAVRKVNQRRSGDQPSPELVGLAEFLSVPDEDTAFRVEQLWPVGGRVVLAAQYKSGKSTLAGNLMRSLADGSAFLDTFPVQQASKIALIDNELDPRTLRRWLRDQGIENPDRVTLLPLRGSVASFDLLDATTRSEWAKVLRGADVAIFDCLRPVLDALALSEDKDAGRFLVAFDALLKEADISEALVVHHMGHNAERSRGDSRILDWPDATWRLVREDPDDLTSARYLTAFGRDVDVPEGQLSYDPSTRHLVFLGGSRKDAVADGLVSPLMTLLEANPEGLSGRQIEEIMLSAGHSRAPIRAAIKRAQDAGHTVQSVGPRRAIIHRHASVRQSAPEVRQRTEIECASAPIGAHGALTHDQRSAPEEKSAHSIGDEGTDAQVACKGCFRPVARAVAEPLDGRCWKCAREAGLM